MNSIELSDSSDEEIRFLPVSKPESKDGSDEVIFCGVKKLIDSSTTSRISSLSGREVTIKSVRKQNSASNNNSEEEIQFLGVEQKSKEALKTVGLGSNRTASSNRLESNFNININSQKSLNTNLTINIEDDSDNKKKKVQLTFLGQNNRGISGSTSASNSNISKFNPIVCSTPRTQRQDKPLTGNLGYPVKTSVSSTVNNLNAFSSRRFNFRSPELIVKSNNKTGGIIVANHCGPPIRLQGYTIPKKNITNVSNNATKTFNNSRMKENESNKLQTVLHKQNNNKPPLITNMIVNNNKQTLRQSSAQTIKRKDNNELNVKSKKSVVIPQNKDKKDVNPLKAPSKTMSLDNQRPTNFKASNATSKELNEKLVATQRVEKSNIEPEKSFQCSSKTTKQPKNRGKEKNESRKKSPQPSLSKTVKIFDDKSHENSPQPSCSKIREKSRSKSPERRRTMSEKSNDLSSDSESSENVRGRSVQDKKKSYNNKNKSSVPSTSKHVTKEKLSIPSTSKHVTKEKSSDSSDQESNDTSTSESSSSDELDDAEPSMKKPQLDGLFNKFLLNCCNKSSKAEVLNFKTKMKKHYLNTKDAVGNKEFILTLKEANVALETKPIRCPLNLMQKVLTHLRRNSPDTERKIKRLELVLQEVNAKIKTLEEAEVTSDEDEGDNNYMKLSRYRKRAVQIYTKISELCSTPADADRPTNRNVSFLATVPEEFSRSTSISNLVSKVGHALEKYYNKSRKFPDFSDVKKLIIKLSIEASIKIRQETLHQLAKGIFVDFGTMLQRRRLHDDYRICSEYLDSETEDPYFHDPALASKLNANRKFRRKEQDVLNKYCMKQVILKDKGLSDIEGSDSQSSLCEDSIESNKKRKTHPDSESDDCGSKHKRRIKLQKRHTKESDTDSSDEENEASRRHKRKIKNKNTSSSSSSDSDNTPKKRAHKISDQEYFTSKQNNKKQSKSHESDATTESESEDHFKINRDDTSKAKKSSSLRQSPLKGDSQLESSVTKAADISEPDNLERSENELSTTNNSCHDQTTAIMTTQGAVIDLSDDDDNENLEKNDEILCANSKQNNAKKHEISKSAMELDLGTLESAENREQSDNEENVEYNCNDNPQTNGTDLLQNDEENQDNDIVHISRNEQENSVVDMSQNEEDNQENCAAEDLPNEEDNQENYIINVSQNEEDNQEIDILDEIRNEEKGQENSIANVPLNEEENQENDFIDVSQEEEDNQENSITQEFPDEEEDDEGDKLEIIEELTNDEVDKIQIISVTTCSQPFSSSQGIESNVINNSELSDTNKSNKVDTIVLTDDEDQDCIIVEPPKNVLTNEEVIELIPIILSNCK